MSSEDAALLRGMLGREPRNDIVEYMKAQGLLRTSEGKELLDAYKRLEAHFPGSTTPTFDEIPSDTRTKALSRIIALDAAERTDVREFRQEVLKGHLVEWPRVADWINHVAAKAFESITRKGGQRVRIVGHLRYLSDGTSTVTSIEIVAGSPLAKLKKIVNALGEGYPAWHGLEAHVVQFVLAGTPPPIPLARFDTRRADRFSAQSRITITIDPRVSPRILAEKYSEVRRPLIGKALARDRPMTDKHLELGLLAEEKRRTRITWEDLMGSWNANFPKWAYTGKYAYITFSRDARNAWSRITGDIWPSG